MSARKSGPIDYNALPDILRPLAERSEIHAVSARVRWCSMKVIAAIRC